MNGKYARIRGKCRGITLLGFILITFTLAAFAGNIQPSVEHGMGKIAPSAVHAPIYFNNNSDMDAFFAGNGTDGSFLFPYVLTDVTFNIDSLGDHTLHIQDTDRYLWIVNMRIAHLTYYGGWNPTLENVSHVLFINCEFDGGLVAGVEVEDCFDISFVDCTFDTPRGTGHGLIARNTDYMFLSGCTASNQVNGFIVSGSSHLWFHECTANGNERTGFAFSNTDYALINTSTASNNGENGITITGDHNRVIGSTIRGNGEFLDRFNGGCYALLMDGVNNTQENNDIQDVFTEQLTWILIGAGSIVAFIVIISIAMRASKKRDMKNLFPPDEEVVHHDEAQMVQRPKNAKGRLFLTNRRVYFKSYKDMTSAWLGQIGSVRSPGKNLEVTMEDGSTLEFSVKDKDKWVNAINEKIRG